MKNVIKIIGLCTLAIIIIVGIHYSIPPKTFDFRGTVTEIKSGDNKVTFYISNSTGVSYIVVADMKTKVSHCHEDDPEITLDGIQVGDVIEGDYRWMTKDNIAKYVTVWCQTGL